MMIIHPPNHIHMERDPRRHRPTAQPMMNHLAIQRSDHRSRKVEITNEERAGGYIDDGAGEGLVEGRIAVAETGEAGSGT